MADSTSDDGIMVERVTPKTRFDPLSLIRYIPQTSRSVLDCACGDGTRAKRLKEQANRIVVGVERHPDNAARAKQHLDDVSCGEIANLDLPFYPSQFDCILGDGILARVQDPYTLLKKFFSWLTLEGMLILTIPNLQYYKTVLMLAEGHWTYEEDGIMARENTYFFTAYEIIRMLRAVGYGTVRLTGLVVEDSKNVTPDQNGCLQFGRITIGPLEKDQVEMFRTEHYLVLASKGGG